MKKENWHFLNNADLSYLANTEYLRDRLAAALIDNAKLRDQLAEMTMHRDNMQRFRDEARADVIAQIEIGKGIQAERDEALRKLKQARELLNQIGGPRSKVNQVATTPPEPD